MSASSTQPLSEAQILAALTRIKGPELAGNIVDLGLVSGVVVRDGKVFFAISVPAKDAEALEPMRQAAEKVVAALPGVHSVMAVLTAERAPGSGPRQSPMVASKPQAAPRAPEAKPGIPGVPGIRHIIAVASGKGGVGKSTTAVNLALGFQAMGLETGVLDVDIYGPSVPKLLGIASRPEAAPNGKLRPLESFGLKAMSMGFLVEEDQAMIWRGPMITSAIVQMLREVNWGNLDVLVLDMPPGTGDAQLTIAQQAPVSGAVIVSTPQDLALIDARKGLNMFRDVDVPVLGLIENMSYYICPCCGERYDIFSHGGAEKEAARVGLPFLGAIPLNGEIRRLSDEGLPITATEPDSPFAAIYKAIAKSTWAELQQREARRQRSPSIKFDS